MSAAHDLLRELAEHHVRIERRGDKLKLRAPAAPPAELLERLRQHRPEVLCLLPDPNRRPVVQFRFPDTPPNAWAVALGLPGESVESLVAGLKQRWPGVEVRP